MMTEEEKKESRARAHKKWKNKNREKFLEQKKRYYSTHRERLLAEQAERSKDPVKHAKRLASAKQRTADLTDGYVRYNLYSCLKQQGITIDINTITSEMIELQRKTIMTKRTLKSYKS